VRQLVFVELLFCCGPSTGRGRSPSGHSAQSDGIKPASKDLITLPMPHTASCRETSVRARLQPGRTSA
jgi:hypothetical protein